MTRSPLRSGRAERDQKSFSLFRGQQKSRQGFLHNERAAARCARLCASLSPLAAQLMSIAADATNNCPPVFALFFFLPPLHVARAEKERYIFRNARHVCTARFRTKEQVGGNARVCVSCLCLRVCFFVLPFSTPRRHPPRPRRRRTRRRPPRSPSRARRGPREPRRTHPPPYPRRRTSARRRAWST